MRGYDVRAAARTLARRDPALGQWMRKIGPVEADPRWRRSFDPVDALARAILHQQLSGKASATIVSRVVAAAGQSRLDATALARCDDACLRGCGVSANKLRSLRDLVQRAGDGAIPGLRRMQWMSDDAIVETLLPVRGVGRWTVEMLLLFRLGRPDVLPLHDLGIRKGAQILDDLGALPTARELAVRGEAWAPHRSLASLLLWRIVDAGGGRPV